MNKTTLEFGRWPSPVSAEFVAGKALRFQSVQALDDQLYWSEQRPFEQGRTALMAARPDSPPIDLLRAPFSVHSRVHEYGGGAFLATPEQLFFVNGEDQQIWSMDNPLSTHQSRVPQAKFVEPQLPKQITNAPDWRFADLVLDHTRNRLICVGELHGEDAMHPTNALISISLDEPAPEIEIIFDGDDFYASPQLSPNAKQLAFISWNLPNMPWETALLQIAHINPDGAAVKIDKPAPSLQGASFQPEWDKNGHLWFINDDTGFGQLYRFDGREVTGFFQRDAEAGLPQWVFGMKTYGFLDDGRVAGIYASNRQARLSLLDPKTGERHDSIGFCALGQLVTTGENVAGILSQKSQPDAITTINCKTGEQILIKSSASLGLPDAKTSIAQTLSFKNNLAQHVYGHYYPPASRTFKGRRGELPPVILTAHGGPTGFSDCGFKPKVQFWTSRGFGYFDVNYSGSWGFGKAYRQRLDGQWGVRDVADMVAAAQFLVENELADPARLLISGSSAGGYTVLMALVSSSVFAAGASYYGISDLARLHDSTHKFEAGYLTGLLGLTPSNTAATLKARSPLFHADQISSPVIFFQGLKDKVVPPDQAELMVEALKERGLETVYKTFENEGHGFRSSQTIESALTMEYDFYAKVLNL